MKPYGRDKVISGGNNWKIDRHPRPKKKWINWWEDITDYLCRSTMKQNLKKELNEIL